MSKNIIFCGGGVIADAIAAGVAARTTKAAVAVHGVGAAGDIHINGVISSTLLSKENILAIFVGVCRKIDCTNSRVGQVLVMANVECDVLHITFMIAEAGATIKKFIIREEKCKANRRQSSGQAENIAVHFGTWSVSFIISSSESGAGQQTATKARAAKRLIQEACLEALWPTKYAACLVVLCQKQIFIDPGHFPAALKLSLPSEE